MSNKIVVLASDHAGFIAKKTLIEYLKVNLNNLKIIDVGTNDESSCDYPDYTEKFNEEFNEQMKENKESVAGIVLCGSGVGVSIGANRNENVTCCLIHNDLELDNAIKHKANVIALGGRVLSTDDINKFSLKFLNK